MNNVVGGSAKSAKPKHLLSVVLVGFFVVALAFIATYVIQQNNKSFDSIYTDAKTALDKRDYDEAYKLLKSIESSDEAQKSYRFYADIAQATYSLGKKDKAKEYALSGIKLYKEASSDDRNSEIGVRLNDISTDTQIEDSSTKGGESSDEAQEDQEFQG